MTRRTATIKEQPPVSPESGRPELCGSSPPPLVVGRQVGTALLITIVLVVPLIGALALLGGYGSFAAIRELAYPRFGERAWTIPIGIDVGILALLAVDLLLEYLGIGWPILRWVAWGFIGCTVYLNFASADHDAPAAVMQVSMPVLFITVLEGVRHLIRRTSGLAADTHIDKIPVARRLYAPLTSLMLHRRMVLWHVRDYRQGLHLEYEHLQAVSRLQERYGRWLWRWRAPLSARVALRLQAARWADLHEHLPNRPDARASDDVTHLPRSSAPQRSRAAGSRSSCPPDPTHPSALSPPSQESASPAEGRTAAGDPGDAASPAHGPTPRNPSSPKDRELLRAAQSIAQQLHRDGARLSQVALAEHLRQQGFSIANERLRWLIEQVEATCQTGSPQPRSSPNGTSRSPT